MSHLHRHHPWLDDIEYQELAAQVAAERRAARRQCPECRCVGGHAFGCPEDDRPEPDALHEDELADEDDATDETEETNATERTQP